jgi:hypothetical protein
MNENKHRVTVVVDPEFGTRLHDLLIEEAVWIVDSSTNAPVIHAIWHDRKSKTSTEVTCFKFDSHASPEDWLIAELSTIELHHGEYSHDPPWSVLNAVGVPWSDRIASELAEFGFTQHVDTPLGFEAQKE